jgi:DNA (cytosine-5)-methyltransferase 1
MNELALFAGAGGGILGGKLLGWRTVCAVEINAYCRSVLLSRQRDGALESFPIWDDVNTFDGNPWRGRIGVVSGGFPCQDISSAGKGAGIRGSKSGLWKEFARIISEVQPRYVFVENSPQLVHRGLDVVLGDLSTLGYDARWGMFRADWCGLHQRRERIYLLAYPMRGNGSLARYLPGSRGITATSKKYMAWKAKSEPPMVGVADGLAYRMDSLRALGNGQVPAVVRLAWEWLSQGIV